MNPTNLISAQALSGSLPDAFDFYQLGRVSLAGQAVSNASFLAAELEGQARVAFTLKGDLAGLLVLAFDSGLDLSTYMEMGNIIASRLVTAVTQNGKLDVLLSPPES